MLFFNLLITKILIIVYNKKKKKRRLFHIQKYHRIIEVENMNCCVWAIPLSTYTRSQEIQFVIICTLFSKSVAFYGLRLIGKQFGKELETVCPANSIKKKIIKKNIFLAYHQNETYSSITAPCSCLIYCSSAFKLRIEEQRIPASYSFADFHWRPWRQSFCKQEHRKLSASTYLQQ